MSSIEGRSQRAVGVLLVDDAEEARRLLRTALRVRGGFDVVGEASEGASAVRLAAALRPDVVVLDLGLPDLAGREVLTRLREVSPLSKVVIFTGTPAAAEGVAQRADAFVWKDADVDYLIELLSSLGRRAGTDAELYLASEPSSVSAARAFTRTILSIWEAEDVCDDTVLVVSELVTNALLHGQSPCRLRLSSVPGRVRVEVLDEGVGTPDPRLSTTSSEHGRGLYLVAQFTSSWGTEPLGGGGKLVWAELARHTAEGTASRTDAC